MGYVFESLGITQLTSGAVIVSDPCYELGTWCQGRLDNVAKGKWHAAIVKNDDAAVQADWEKNRVRELILLHEDHSHLFKGVEAGEETYYADWALAPFHVGVDSGQAGIFDATIYGDNDAIQIQDGDLVASSWLRPGRRHGAFYAAMCGLTCKDNSGCAGTFSRGAVSASGYGDGGYNCHYLTVNDEIVGIAIIFIDDRNDDDEDEDIEDTSDELTTLMAGGDPIDRLYRDTLKTIDALKNLEVDIAADTNN